uniref:Beta-glucosidase n=1 Tax=Fagus sylvatica TaxID=28930 RepID=A0A2N9IWR6_FAGSY
MIRFILTLAGGCPAHGRHGLRSLIGFPYHGQDLFPNGRGAVNPKGLQYYNNLINELISHGIQPHVTLHHADLPQVLEDEYGGWVSRKIVYGSLPLSIIHHFFALKEKDFTAYADVCFRKFGDRVSYWTTLNEANVFVIGGYDSGVLPPQRCSPPYGVNCSRGNSSTEPYMAAHHILLAHASAARLYKQRYQDKQNGFIGLNLFSYWFVPLTNSMEDKIATQRANDFLLWFVDPLVFGDYPDVLKKIVGSRLPAFTYAESSQVKGSFDFLGVNHYNTLSVKDNPSSPKDGRWRCFCRHGSTVSKYVVDILNSLKTNCWFLQLRNAHDLDFA